MYRFGWYGLALVLPESLNLTYHTGNAAKGALLFSDLSATRFEMRWRTPRALRLFRVQPRVALHHLIARLQRRHQVTAFAHDPPAFRMARGDCTHLLTADSRRIFELSWPAPVPGADNMDFISADFLQNVQVLDMSPHWLWEVYGAQGWLPRGARLRRCILLPGRTEMSFHYRGGQATLGNCSLANRLLAGRSLKTWAGSALPILRKNHGGNWKEAENEACFSCQNQRLFPLPHIENCRVTVSHDHLANRIRWTHHCEKVKKGNLFT
jgi:hypothetical protein